VDLATKLMNGKYLKSAKLTDVYAKVKKLVGYGVDLPQSFQWTLLELESARLCKMVREEPAEETVAEFLNCVCVLSDSQATTTFDPTKPSLQPIKANIREKVSWMSRQLIDEVLVPELLTGEDGEKTVLLISTAYVDLFELDGGITADDTTMESLLQIITCARAMKAMCAIDINEKSELIDDVLSMWSESTSSQRSPCSLVAKTVDANAFWRGRIETMTTNPASWKELGPQLKATMDQMKEMKVDMCVMVANVAVLKSACGGLLGFKSTFGEQEMMKVEESIWQKVSATWTSFKQGLDVGKCPVSSTEMMNFLSFAQTSFPSRHQLQDMISECSSILLTCDGTERMARFVNACEFFTKLGANFLDSGQDLSEKLVDLQAALEDVQGIKVKSDDTATIEAVNVCAKVFLEFTCASIDGKYTLSAAALSTFESFATRATLSAPAVSTLSNSLVVKRLADSINDNLAKTASAVKKDDGGIDNLDDLVSNGYQKLRELLVPVMQLEQNSVDIPADWGDVKATVNALVEKAKAIHAKYADTIVSAKLKDTREQVKIIEKICEGGDGAAWNHDLAPGGPWTAMTDHFRNTLGKFDIKGLDHTLKITKSLLADYSSACSTLCVQEEEFIGVDSVCDKAAVTVATSRLFDLMLGNLKGDKVKLRKATLAECDKIMDKNHENPNRLLAMMPAMLRSRLDLAIKMKSI